VDPDVESRLMAQQAREAEMRGEEPVDPQQQSQREIDR